MIPKRVINKILEERKNLWKAERQGYIQNVLIIVITKKNRNNFLINSR
jgi:hypothetical protein